MTSFAELASASFTLEIESKELRQFGPVIAVESKCGRKAMRIFSLLTYREACKEYGNAGAIILTPQEIAESLGMPVATVIGCVISLIRNGFAKPTSDGKAVKAA